MQLGSGNAVLWRVFAERVKVNEAFWLCPLGIAVNVG
jgi:hypothetical protein